MKMINNLKGAHPPKVISDLRDLFKGSAERFPDRIAYYFFGRDGKQHTWTFQDAVNLARYGWAEGVSKIQQFDWLFY